MMYGIGRIIICVLQAEISTERYPVQGHKVNPR